MNRYFPNCSVADEELEKAIDECFYMRQLEVNDYIDFYNFSAHYTTHLEVLFDKEEFRRMKKETTRKMVDLLNAVIELIMNKYPTNYGSSYSTTPCSIGRSSSFYKEVYEKLLCSERVLFYKNIFKYICGIEKYQYMEHEYKKLIMNLRLEGKKID